MFLLDGSPPLVLHVKHPPIDLDSLAWEHQLVRRLSERLPEVPAPLPAHDGRTFVLHQGKPVWLTLYLTGSPAQPSDRRVVAAALARLHSVTIDLPLRPGHSRIGERPIPAVGEMPREFDPWLPLISQARSDMIGMISQINETGRITVGITHNDIFPGNVLIKDAQVTALLDWEEADIDWLVWDVACSIWPFRGMANVGAAIADFIAGYRDAGGRLPPDEEELIIPLIRAKRILEVLRAPTDRDPRWDLQLANLGAYEALR